MSSNTEEAMESSLSDFVGIENLVKDETILMQGRVCVIEKTGKLLANTHCILVKKAFKRLQRGLF